MLTGESSEEFLGLSITEQIDKLIKHLNQQRCLLVVDNLEALLNNQRWKDEGYRQFFSYWSEQGKNTVIFLTSQEIPISLRHENWLMLGGFSSKEGGNFLASFGLGTNSNQNELENISKMLDGNPLALRLTAKYINLYCQGDNVLAQARQAGLIGFSQITKEASGDHRGEPTCLEQVLERHLGRLAQEERLNLIALSVYRLPFSENAATEIIESTEPVKALVFLEAFVQRSLLIKEQSFYQIQPSIQRYLQSLADRQLKAHKKAAAFYQKNINPEPWSDIEDIRFHLELFYHQCQTEDYLNAFKTAEIVAEFLDLRGYGSQLLNMYDYLRLNWQDNITNQKEYSIIWNRLGSIFYYSGQTDSSSYCYQQAIGLSRNVKEKRCEAIALKGLGDVYNRPKYFDRAVNYYQQSLKTAQEIGDRYVEVDALSGLGRAYFERGQYDESIDAYEKALERHRAAGIKTKRDRKIELDIIRLLGVSYKWQHEYEMAIKVHQELLLKATNIGDKKHEFDALFGLGFIKMNQDQYGEARSFYNRALEVARDIGSQRSEAGVLTDLGRICQACEQYSEAIQYYEQSLKLSNKLGNRHGISWTLMHEATTYRSLEDYKKAIDLYKEALNIAYEIDEFRHVIWTLCDMGFAYDLMEQFGEAKRVYQEAINISKKTGYRHHEAISYLMQTISLAKPGDNFNALKSVQRAKTLFQEMGIKDEERHCDKVSYNYVFNTQDQSNIQFKRPSIQKPKFISQEISRNVPTSSSQGLDLSSIVSSLSITFYLLMFLFIIANFIQGHLILAILLLTITLVLFLLQKFSKFSKSR